MIGRVSSATTQSNVIDGYIRATGVPDGETILANAPMITQLGTDYYPIWYICAKNTFLGTTFAKAGGSGTDSGADAYVFSDDLGTLHVGTTVTHNFDVTQDFATDGGFKCRYIIGYATAANVAASTGITINLYGYRATFEFIGSQYLKLNAANNYSKLFGYNSTNYSQIKYINLSSSTFYNNYITNADFCANCLLLQTILLPVTLYILNESSVPGATIFGNCQSLTKLILPNVTTIFPYNSNSHTFLGLTSLTYLAIPSVSVLAGTGTTFASYARFIQLPNNFNISGCNFSGNVSNGITKTYDWINTELVNKLADRSATTTGTMIIGAANIALMTSATIAALTARNWSFT